MSKQGYKYFHAIAGIAAVIFLYISMITSG
ncbi:hypothetical protein J2Z82_003210 [Virgibacillus litoralis]|uniref:Uncharacterized protein n=1 Tax=Virgibacillus litoralis TaxID=578221 RepID=A0ABS4HH84_9BACI|nr:hypothetical protein [Virgibacillus litoralis]